MLIPFIPLRPGPAPQFHPLILTFQISSPPKEVIKIHFPSPLKKGRSKLCIFSMFDMIFNRQHQINQVLKFSKILKGVHFIFAIGLVFYRFFKSSDIIRTQHLLSDFFCRYLSNLCQMKITVLNYVSLFQRCKIILSNNSLLIGIRQPSALKNFL